MDILVIDSFSLRVQQVGRDLFTANAMQEGKSVWTGPISKFSKILPKPLGIKDEFMCSKIPYKQ